jgi:hypothetical protein
VPKVKEVPKMPKVKELPKVPKVPKIKEWADQGHGKSR